MGPETAGSAWTALSASKKRASRFSFASGSASVTSIRAYIDGRGATSGSQPVRAVIYSNSSGVPSKRLASTNPVTINAGQAAQAVTLSFSSPVQLAAGSYWLGLHSGGTTGVARYAATTVSNALRFNTKTDAYSDGAASTFGSTKLDNKQMSIAAMGSGTFTRMATTTTKSTSRKRSPRRTKRGKYTLIRTASIR